MAVPGPVTSRQSAGCYQIIRESGATCVARGADIIEMVTPLGDPDIPVSARGPRPAALPARGPADAGSPPPRDELDPDSARVLDALPARGAAGPSTIAVEAGADPGTVLRCLGLLAGRGFIERPDRGWRLRRR